MAGLSDGAIVGIAVVKLIAQYGRKAAPYVGDYVQAMKAAVKCSAQYPYRFRYLTSSAAAMTAPSSSAAGVASHTPVTPPSRMGMI